MAKTRKEVEDDIKRIPIINSETEETIGTLGEYNESIHYYDIIASVDYADVADEEKYNMLINFNNKYDKIYDYEAKAVVFSLGTYTKYKKTVFDLADGERRSKKDMVGTYECRTCKKKKTTSRAVQVRGADEPMTVFLVCYNPDCRANGRTITFSEA